MVQVTPVLIFCMFCTLNAKGGTLKTNKQQNIKYHSFALYLVTLRLNNILQIISFCL